MSRIAWFSPLPPVRSGVAAYSREVLPLLAVSHDIDVFVPMTQAMDRETGTRGVEAPPGVRGVWSSGEFIPRHAPDPFDLIVYQLGNATWHDYMWGYVVRYPGLAVLHDAMLHHARAGQLMRTGRPTAYRAELRYDQPDAPANAAELAIAGIDSPLYYDWPLVRPILETARLTVVHNALVAADLAVRYPGVRMEAIRMGVADPGDGRTIGVEPPNDRRRPVVFALFGLVTPEKRVPAILRALSRLRSTVPARLRLIGEITPHYDVVADIRALGLSEAVEVIGYADDETMKAHLRSADVCLCLRWPTAGETSASWLRCLAAGQPTVVTRLAHLLDVPLLEPMVGENASLDPDAAPIAVAVDLWDEEDSLLLAMRRLATDDAMRLTLGRHARAYWRSHHTLSLMAQDYERVIDAALQRQPATPPGLPSHFLEDGTAGVRRLTEAMGVTLDWLGQTTGADRT